MRESKDDASGIESDTQDHSLSPLPASLGGNDSSGTHNLASLVYGSPFTSLPDLPRSEPLTPEARQEILAAEGVNLVEAQEAEQDLQVSRKLAHKSVLAIVVLLGSMALLFRFTIPPPPPPPPPPPVLLPYMLGLPSRIQEAVRRAQYHVALSELRDESPPPGEYGQQRAHYETMMFLLYHVKDPDLKEYAERIIRQFPDADKARLMFAKATIRGVPEKKESIKRRQRRQLFERLDNAIGHLAPTISKYESRGRGSLNSQQIRALRDAHDLTGQLHVLKWLQDGGYDAWVKGQEHYAQGHNPKDNTDKLRFLITDAERALDLLDWGWVRSREHRLYSTVYSEHSLREELASWRELYTHFQETSTLEDNQE